MKFNEAAGKLATLEYRVYNLQELVDIVKKIDNFKEKTLDKLQPAPTYKNYTNLVRLSDLKVDCRYQRKMRLQHLVKKLVKQNGFIAEAAGHIDVAQRHNVKGEELFVWDGFRRALMAALAGLEYLPASIYTHPTSKSIKECVAYEAKMFKIRNADSEKMKPEEIFRSQVVYDDAEAIKFLNFLKECCVDVEGLNPGNPELGGFVQVHSSWNNGWVTEDNLILSSSIIQKTWNDSPSLSGYLLCGLGLFLDVNEYLDNSYEIEEVIDSFAEYINLIPPNKQESLIKNRLSGLANQSIAYSIASKVMKMNRKHLNDFVSNLNLAKEDVEVLNSLS